jgi:hypothetical protein
VAQRRALGLGLLGLLELHEAAADGGGGRLRAVAHAELAEQAVHVRLDRALGRVQLVGDLAVAVAADDEPQHVHLTARQVGATGLVEHLRDARRDVLPALVHGDDGLEQLVARHALEHVGGGAGRQGARDVDVALVHGEHHHAGFRELGADGADGLGALHHRHAQVHDREVGLCPPEGGNGLFTVARGGDHRKARMALEHGHQALAQDVVIVRHEQADR